MMSLHARLPSEVGLPCPEEGWARDWRKRAAVGTDPWLWGQERELELRRQALEEERRRREQVERRLQSESARRRQLVETEVKMREKQFSQVSGCWGSVGGWLRVSLWRGRDIPGYLFWAVLLLFYSQKDCCWLSTSRILPGTQPQGT